jgi:hypothetical protein
VIVSVNERLSDQLQVTGLADFIGHDNIYRSTERVGTVLEQAYRDARAWIAEQDGNGGHQEP